MSRASNYLENALINHIFRNIALPSPTALYLAAHNGDPGDTGANEMVGDSYARIQISTVGGTEFEPPVDGVTRNVNEKVFEEVITGWGTITHLSLWDALTGGNCWIIVPTDLAQELTATATLRVAAGKLIGQVR